LHSLGVADSPEVASSPKCVEGVSLLKMWLSARSALQESPKTSPKHYENNVFGPRTGGTREREGVFQHAEVISEVERLMRVGTLSW
jgi:hypothetical protein